MAEGPKRSTRTVAPADTVPVVEKRPAGDINFISQDNAQATKEMATLKAGKKSGGTNTTLVLLVFIIVLLSAIVLVMYL